MAGDLVAGDAHPGRRLTTIAVAGIAAGVGLRLGMAVMVRHVVRAGLGDHRFAAKGIGPRAAAMVPAVSLAVPALWLAGRRGPYPAWLDNLLLSIVALDLAGNVLDLYDRYLHFDLIPHAHGTGALTVVVAGATGLSTRRAAELATTGHVLLEIQEIVSDVVFGYRNVRGWWDTAGDIAAGAVGTVAYGLAYEHLVRRRGHAPEPLVPLG